INATVESLRVFWDQFVHFIPQILVAALLLILGWLVAKILRKAMIRVLRLLRVDVAAEKAGIEDFLIQGDVKYTTITIVANLIYWFVIFAVSLAVLNSLGLAAAADLFNRIILYIPNVIVAVLVLIFGTLFAKLVRGVTFTYLSNIGIAGAEFVSQVAQWALLLFVVSVALEQLAIGGQILVSAFQIAFGALCLALALAFGLGGKEWAARILEKIRKTER
ncbi:MAG: hypothetical protein ABI623_06680, partial [bacterium]